MRGAGFSLAAIGELLAEPDPAAVRERLDARREELDADRRERDRALDRLDRLYGGASEDAAAMLAAATAGDVETVRGLIERDPTLVHAVDLYDKTPLHLAAEHDHAELAARLLDAGAELEAETSWGMTPLQWGAVLGSGAAGAVLLARGASLDLPSAAGLGLLDDVRSFDEDGAVVSDAFYLAARNGRIEVARFLLERGAEIDHRGYFGAPGLHWAAINGHADTVRLLLAEGADPTIRDEEFAADALGWAREGGDEAVVALLAK